MFASLRLLLSSRRVSCRRRARGNVVAALVEVLDDRTLLSGTPAPEVDVRSGVSVLIDDVSTVDFGDALATRGGVTRTFSVKNVGSANLILQPATLTSNNGFSFVGNFTRNQVVAPDATVNLVVRLDDRLAGVKSAQLSFRNNDADESPFGLALNGRVTAPEIVVKNGAANVADGTGIVSFGSVLKGSPSVIRTLTVTNTGNGDLVLQKATVTANRGYAIVTNFQSNQRLMPGAAATLTVRLDSTSLGDKNAILSFVNTDSDENPFNFTLKGSVTAPEISMLNGSSNVASGTGVVNFFSAVQGSGGVARTLVVRNTGSSALILQPAVISSGSGFAIITNVSRGQRILPGGTASLVMRLNDQVLGDQSATISIRNNDSDENPFVFNVKGRVTKPEISVTDGGKNVADAGDISFGSVLQGSAGITRTFVVRNSGNADLILQKATVTAGSGFTVLNNFAANQVLVPGGTVNLVVRLDSVKAGSKATRLSFVNSDADENPFDIDLTGIVLAPEIVVKSGAVDIADGSGRVDFGAVLQGSSGVTKTFTVTNTGDGDLFLQKATVTANRGYAIVTNFQSNQKVAPGASANLVVRLGSAALGDKNATLSFANTDSNENPFNFALQGSVTAPEITVSVGNVDLPDGTGVVGFGSVVKDATAITRTVVIRNTGNANLVLQPATVTANRGFTIVTNLTANQILVPNAAVNLVLRMDSAIAGVKSASVSFANTDRNESPFNFSLSGRVNQLPQLPVYPTQTTPELAEFSFDASGSDPDAGSILRYSFNGSVPAGIKIAPATGLITWTPTESQGPNSYVVSVRVTDETNLTVTRSLRINVTEVNVAPVFNPVSTRTVFVGELLQFTVFATDADLPANNLTYSLAPNQLPGVQFNSFTRTVSWTPTQAQVGFRTIEVRATDGLATTALFIKVRVFLERDPGETVATAMDVGDLETTPFVYNDRVGDVVDGEIDFDIYKFTLMADSNLNAVFGGLTKNIIVQIFVDSNGDSVLGNNEVLETSYNSDSSSKTVFEPLSAGTYFLSVSRRFQNDNTAYSLSLSAAGLVGDDSVPDPGSTVGTARDMGVLNAAAKTTVDTVHNFDTDIYKFTISADSNVTAAFSGLSENVVIQICLDSNGDSVLGNNEVLETSYNSDSSSKTVFEPLSAGAYFLIVSARFGEGNTAYSLSLSAAGLAGDDSVPDPGSTVGTARDMGVLNAAAKTTVDTVHNFDTDIYKFTISANSNVTAAFSGLSENVVIQICVDTNGDGVITNNEVISTNYNSDSSEKTVFESLASGTYFLIVSARFSEGNTAYSLSLSSVLS